MITLAVLATLVTSACGGDDAATTTPAGQATGTTSTTSTTSTTGTTGTTSTSAGPLAVDPDGVSTLPADDLAERLDSLSTSPLTNAERDALAFMREEERLAEDVYRALAARWNLQIFTNIADAEVTHTASVKTLLDRYQLPDPSAGMAAGTYQNATIAGLYSSLVAQGSTSLIAALQVGALIEELDIADLQARATTTPDIALVYANLEKGSRNHLRAFVSQLTSRGATYTPTHISASAFDAIVSTPTERGAAR